MSVSELFLSAQGRATRTPSVAAAIVLLVLAALFEALVEDPLARTLTGSDATGHLATTRLRRFSRSPHRGPSPGPRVTSPGTPARRARSGRSSLRSIQ